MKTAWLAGAVLVGLFAGLSGCGTVGPPIAPEDIGLAAKLLKDKEKAGKAGRKPGEEKPANEVVLPPVRPVGMSAGSQEDESLAEPKR
ncbi:MAG: hypothetical protein FJ246_06265 [Nitrospira sp.]|nr:hypothetical protein [Nitrospira sp.]